MGRRSQDPRRLSDRRQSAPRLRPDPIVDTRTDPTPPARTEYRGYLARLGCAVVELRAQAAERRLETLRQDLARPTAQTPADQEGTRPRVRAEGAALDPTVTARSTARVPRRGATPRSRSAPRPGRVGRKGAAQGQPQVQAAPAG